MSGVLSVVLVLCVSFFDSGVVVDSISVVCGSVWLVDSSVCRWIGDVMSMCGCGSVLSLL